MPKPSTKNAQVEDQTDAVENQEEEITVSNVECENFDVTRLGFRGQIPQEGATMNTYFPKYLYKQNMDVTRKNCVDHGESLIAITPPIKMTKGGIPKHNPKYYTNDPDSVKRAYFYIPRNDDDENTKKLFDMIQEIDDYMDQEINVKQNKNGILYTISSKTKKEVPTKGLTYKRMISKSQPPQSDDDEDDSNKKQYQEWERVKVKFSVKYDPELAQDEPREITTQVYLKDQAEPENFTKLTEIEKYFTWNCTAQFALMFNKVWAKKTDKRECSIGIKCVQIGITEYAESRSTVSKQLNRNLFARPGSNPPRQMTTPTQNKKQKSESEEENNGSDNEESDNEEQNNGSDNEGSDNEDQNNDSENEGSQNEGDEDNEDAESSESEEPAPPPKKGAKVAGKSTGKNDKTQNTKGKGAATKNRK